MIIAIRFLLCVIVALVLFAGWLYLRQDRMIFHPRPYGDRLLAEAPQRAVKIEYSISCGRQASYYVPPRTAKLPTELPARLWILFAGNGSLGLHWRNVINASPDSDAGFLMLDYPGYGHCEGEPSPKSMAESGDAMVKALAEYLDVPVETLMSRKIRLMGHSLGSGIALEFATRHHVDRVVLVSPFTTFRAMADRVVSPWLGWLIRHNLDNQSALRILAAQQPPPQVVITHGTADDVVPVEMARQLESDFPDFVNYIEISGADHGNILDGVEYYTAPGLPDPVTSLDEARAAALTGAASPPATGAAVDAISR